MSKLVIVIETPDALMFAKHQKFKVTNVTADTVTLERLDEEQEGNTLSVSVADVIGVVSDVG